MMNSTIKKASKKPFVYINSAMSLDGKLSTIERKQVKISNKLDFERVDRLRAESDAIIVGSNTVVIDDPKLTVKSPNLRENRVQKGLPENPVKVLIGSVRDLLASSDFLDYGNAEKIIFTTEKEDPVKVRELEKKASVIVSGKEKVDLKKAMNILYERGIRRVMVEGGGTLNYEMLKAGVVDEVYVAIGPRIFGGKTAPTFVDGEGFLEKDAINLELIDLENMENTVVLRYRVTTG